MGKRGKRDIPAGRFVTLREYMLASPAWQSLDCNARCLFIEIARRYRGPDSNNGKIPYSVREAATALRIGNGTAEREFNKLLDRGFLKIAKDSDFDIEGRVSREWLLTEFPDGRAGKHVEATKEYMTWNPEHGPTTGTDGTHSGTVTYLRRDRAA
jgi:hypothetical protein